MEKYEDPSKVASFATQENLMSQRFFIQHMLKNERNRTRQKTENSEISKEIANYASVSFSMFFYFVISIIFYF